MATSGIFHPKSHENLITGLEVIVGGKRLKIHSKLQQFSVLASEVMNDDCKH